MTGQSKAEDIIAALRKLDGEGSSYDKISDLSFVKFIVKRDSVLKDIDGIERIELNKIKTYLRAREANVQPYP